MSMEPEDEFDIVQRGGLSDDREEKSQIMTNEVAEHWLEGIAAGAFVSAEMRHKAINIAIAALREQEAVQELAETLEDLLACQNGPPLHSEYTAEFWQQTCDKAAKLIDAYRAANHPDSSEGGTP